MLRFADQTYNGIAIYKNEIMCDDYYVKKKVDGMFELVFSLEINNPSYQYLEEESHIFESETTGDYQRYTVKAIDANEKKATIKCKYDLDEWRGNIYWGFSMQDTFANVVRHVLPTGWTLTDNTGDVTTQLVELDACTRLDAVIHSETLWPSLTAIFDNYLKTVTLLNKNNGTNYGAIISRELNLKKLTYRGKSTEFATRLFPMGKDGLKISSVNQGLEYIEDFTYSSDIICAYMIDTGIDDATKLLNAAREVLAEISVPERSYSCDIVDLYAAIGYSWLKIDLFDKVTFEDETKYNGTYTYSVVEYWNYPNFPNKNKIVLSKSAPKIQHQVSRLNAQVDEEQGRLQQQINDIASGQIASLLGGDGGNVRILDTDADGKLDTIFIADNPNPANALNVIRINSTGIARSTTGYSGLFTFGEVWSTTRWAIRGEALPMSFSAVNYVPTTLTYKDGNGATQTVTVLAEQGYVAEDPPDVPIIEEP